MDWNKIIEQANNSIASPTIIKTEDEWKDLLSEEAYVVTRNKGTERAFSSEMCTAFEPGTYACICCDTPLFSAQEKFDSGTGWPSFTLPINEKSIRYIADKSFGMYRVETVCTTCEAHLGHVFPDGPQPSGLRYCINAVSLKKI